MWHSMHMACGSPGVKETRSASGLGYLLAQEPEHLGLLAHKIDSRWGRGRTFVVCDVAL